MAAVFFVACGWALLLSTIADAAHAERAKSRPPRRATHKRPPRPLRPLGIPGKWKLILNSPFSGSSLNTQLWRVGWFGSGVSGPMNQNETACYSPDNVSVPGDGTLHLAVTAVSSTCRGGERSYTGALLSTDPYDAHRAGGFTYQYGVLQARVYVPAAGAGVADWPAVITLGQVWPQDGEDDIMENLEGTVCFHYHSPGYVPGGSVPAGLGGCDRYFGPGWHTVASDWEPGSVTWYYDGIEVGRETQAITAAPMYIVLVNSVSSKGPQVAKPDAMRVAYVRVWQHPQAAPAP